MKTTYIICASLVICSLIFAEAHHYAIIVHHYFDSDGRPSLDSVETYSNWTGKFVR